MYYFKNVEAADHYIWELSSPVAEQAERRNVYQLSFVIIIGSGAIFWTSGSQLATGLFFKKIELNATYYALCLKWLQVFPFFFTRN